MARYRVLFPGQRVPDWLCEVRPRHRARIGSLVIVDHSKSRPLARLLLPFGCIIYVKGGGETVHMDVRFDFACTPVIPMPKLPDARDWIIRRLGGVPAAEHAILRESFDALNAVLDAREWEGGNG